MKTQLLRLAFSLALFAAFCSTASAWNCTTPGQIRVQVPAGTKGNGPGNGDGQVDTVEGITFQCQAPPTAPKSGVIAKQKQDQSQNQNQNQGQTQTANGGAGGAGGSVKDSGNSSSKSSSTSNSSSNSTASASNNGNGNGNGANNSSYDSTTNIAAPKIPVNTAFAPSAAATVTCFKGFGAGVQLPMVGGSLGGGKIDENCAILEAARSGAAYGGRLAFCKVYISNKYVRKAGVTLADCLVEPTVAPAVVSAPVAPAPQITVNVPAPVVQAAPVPVAVASLATFTDLGSFRVNRSYSTGTCPTTKTVLGTAGIAILDRAIKLADKTDAEIILSGNVFTAGVATNYLRKHTRGKVSIQASDDQDGLVNVKVWSEK